MRVQGLAASYAPNWECREPNPFYPPKGSRHYSQGRPEGDSQEPGLRVNMKERSEVVGTYLYDTPSPVSTKSQSLGGEPLSHVIAGLI